jgi:hypothetical protein
MRMPPSDLIQNFMAAREAAGVIETPYRLFKRRGEQEKAAPINVQHVYHYPDGTTKTVTIKTFKELKRLQNNQRSLYATYRKAIMQRGFRQLASSYNAMVTPDCSERWFASGQVAVQQNAFLIRVSQASKSFLGATVENSVIVVFPGGFLPSLSGKYGKKQWSSETHNQNARYPSPHGHSKVVKHLPGFRRAGVAAQRNGEVRAAPS